MLYTIYMYGVDICIYTCILYMYISVYDMCISLYRVRALLLPLLTSLCMYDACIYAVCCSVLQCVAVCCSVLQCVRVCCSAYDECIYAYTSHAYVYIFICMCTYICMYMYIYVYIYMCIYIYTCTHLYIYTCMCIFARLKYICVCVPRYRVAKIHSIP